MPKDKTMKDIRAVCTWGCGPDVLVSVDGRTFLLFEDPTDFNHWTHGVIRKGQLDFTADEAIEFANELLSAAKEAKFLEKQLETYHGTTEADL